MISAVVNTCNEEKYIERCLEHLKWVDEIVVVDMYSTDKSVEIARQYTDKIYFHPRVPSVELVRNFALRKANGDWILIVDPDEVIPEILAQEMLRRIDLNPDFSALAFPRKDIFWDRYLKHAYPLQWQTRLFKKGYVVFPECVHTRPEIKGKVIYLPQEESFCLIHYNFERISQFLEKTNRYTTGEAEDLDKKGVKFNELDLFKKPLAEFYCRYFLRKGYKDGMEGFLFCALMALYRFLAWAKLWEMKKNR